MRQQIRVTGTVQGVGFRPFVYRQALARDLSGWVRNDVDGVLIEAEGSPDELADLCRVLAEDPPALAVVESVQAREIPVDGRRGFAVAQTEARESGAPSAALVGPDVAPCAACLAELADPQDRRFGYPFINCTDCGPRYTIVRDLPYDRAGTTMSDFALCPACRREYDDPTDRRFHAEPIACSRCGPRLAWSAEATADPVQAAVDCLLAGGIVALKGVGGYHLACDATNDASVRALRARKGRADKPLAVMVAELADAVQLCELDEAGRAILSSPRRPVVLVRLRSGHVGPWTIAPGVAPGLAELGLMLPSSPLHVLVTARAGRPLVMTSANRSGEPMTVDDDDGQLSALATGVLSHDRPIHVRADDSVLQVRPGGTQQMLRRSRGWVPEAFALPVASPQAVLAVGAHLKSTVALAALDRVVMSHHLGDLGTWAASQSFDQAVGHLQQLTGQQIAVVAHDLHPDYRSTAWARATGLPTEGVQHHHAHVASCLLEHGRTGPVLALAFDGVGWGDDGTLWGGEFLVADLWSYERVGHLRTAPLPGGDAAVREPWRMAVSWLASALGPDAALDWARPIDPRASAVLGLALSVQPLHTSSVGRLFDAVSAVVGGRAIVSYEGQAAVELEALARQAAGPSRSYAMTVSDGVLDPVPALQALVSDRNRGASPAELAWSFHAGLARGAADLAVTLANANGQSAVVLTGGVFQNGLLSELLDGHLRKAGLEVLLHSQIPCNDGGISGGQAAVAAARAATRTG